MGAGVEWEGVSQGGAGAGGWQVAEDGAGERQGAKSWFARCVRRPMECETSDLCIAEKLGKAGVLARRDALWMTREWPRLGILSDSREPT